MNKERTMAFTGHRNIHREDVAKVRQNVSDAIRKAYSKGYRYFMNGMAYGFDLIAAECLMELKAELPGLKLIAVIPYRGQSERWSIFNQRRYQRIQQQADETIVLNKHYFQACFLQRDSYMVKNASHVIAYYNGIPKGGTYYTIKEAKKLSIPVVNIY